VIINKKVGRRNSKRNLTMPRASASRASNAARGICLALPNCELSTICNPSIPGKKLAQNSKNPANIYECSRPLLTGSVSQTEFVVTRRKQSPKEFLTAARTALSDPATQRSKVRSNPGFFPHNTLSRRPIPSATEVGLNRQIRELEHDVTCRKQKSATCSNGQKNQEMAERVLPAVLAVQTPPRSLDASTENEF
jgi:hypothetical protein